MLPVMLDHRSSTRAASLGSCAVLMVAWLHAAPHCPAAELRGEITDAASGRPVAARVYLERVDDGSWHFVRSASRTAAVPYDKQNWINPRSIERHTSVSATPFVADLAPGTYRLTVERGKEYFPETREINLADEPVHVRVPLRRWIDMAGRGWYSGETHIHRTLDELPVVLQAEDLNVALPLTYWVTKAFTAPAAGDRNVGGEVPDRLIMVDRTHVIWPRNTEYEIFTVGEHRHTLGALFVLNHKSVLTQGVPPWGPVAEQARAEGALLDMDKLDWPFAMTLPHATGATLYELANNHLWRTEFAFREWNSEAPAFLQPPRGGKSGDERDWLHYTLGMYYTLLGAGFPLVPTAGTASGVHPVPVGFSRVYVHLPDGFGYEDWLDGLSQGRSFVTTGPMLFAQVEGREPGARFEPAAGPVNLRVAGTAVSEQPLALVEVVVNGSVARTIVPANEPGAVGERVSAFSVEVPLETSGWLCVRVFEERAEGRVRFAHTAPWWVNLEGRPLRPRREERDYLVGRMKTEIARSRAVLPPQALAEYEAALARFEQLDVRPDDPPPARAARPDRPARPDRDDLAAAARQVRQIVAHRGSSADRPENTLASTRRAIDVGATAVEVDVRTTKDGQLVLLHDATLDRTTTGSGAVRERTLAEVRQLDAGSWFDPQFRDERVPTLREVLAVCRGKADVLLDLKERGEEYATKVAGEVKAHGDPARTIVGVRSVEQALEFRELLPEVRQLGLITRPADIEDYARAGVETIRLWPRWLHDDDSLTARVQRTGAKLHLNGTTGAPDEIRPLLEHRPDSLSADDPARLAATLQEIRSRPGEQVPAP